MSLLEEFKDITRADEPLAPYTWLKVGGPAQYFIEPRNAEELTAVVKHCHQEEIPVRILGGGSNLLVKDSGVSGAVIHLESSDFSKITIEGTTVSSGSGASLSHLITRAVAAGLGGLESLVGIPGTVGGAIQGNAGGREADIGEFVKSVTVLTRTGEVKEKTGDALTFAYRTSSVDELVVLSAEFELEEDDTTEITKRLRKQWILKKSSQPFSFQSAGCIFKNPRGYSAGALIDQAGLKGTRIGGCEVSDRHANFFVTDEEATSEDMLNLIELVRAKVEGVHGVELELELKIWP